MKVLVSGLRKQSKIDEVRNSLEFFASRLMTKRLSKTLTIKVQFLEELEGGYAGTCESLVDGVRPKKFGIQLKRSLPRSKLLRTLAHEMVHVKQYARGELDQYVRNNGKVRWKDRYYAYDSEVDFRTMADEYWDSPWEIDAYGREEGLYKRYLKHLKLCTAP